MYKKILVPLDGSELASSVLPHLREIVSCTHAQVILLRATPEPIFPSVGTGPREPQRIDTPPRTLDGMAWRLKPDPVHRTDQPAARSGARSRDGAGLAGVTPADEHATPGCSHLKIAAVAQLRPFFCRRATQECVESPIGEEH